MKWQKLIAILILLALVLAPWNASVSMAQDDLTSQVAVLLILDNSGSMKTNDPANLRFTAARLFTALLDEGDAVGAILFSTKSRALTDGIVVIRSGEDKQRVVRALLPVAADEWTDMKAAFGAAKSMMSPANLGNRKKVVVFLTDGKPEIDHQYPEYEDETLALARGLGIPVLSIALTEAAQTPFLNRVAAATGGAVLPASDASQLLDAYLDIFGQVKDRTVVGSGRVTTPGTVPLELDPALAPYIESASFVISKPGASTASLLGPDGREVRVGEAGVSFALDDQGFAVGTAAKPAGGRWGFRAQGSGPFQARLILRSRLRAEVITPQRYQEAGQPMPITVRLIEERPGGPTVKIIGEANFSALIVRPDGRQESLDLFYDDGTHGDVRAGDGDYTRLYPNADRAGAYTIEIRGRKGTVPVARTHRVEVIPFPRIVVDEPKSTRYDVRSQPVPFRVHLVGGAPSVLDRGEIIARVKSPSGATTEIVMKPDGEAYSGAILPKEDGTHQVAFVPRDASYKGLPYAHPVDTRFETRIIPTISIGATPVNLGRVELAIARQGLTVTLPMTSTSRQADQLSFRLEEMKGFTVAEASPLSLPPASRTNQSVGLLAEPSASLQASQGKLVFSAREGIDLEGATVPIQVELYRPKLQVSPEVLELTWPTGWFGNSGPLPVGMDSTSSRGERLEVAVQGLEGLIIGPKTVEVAPGTVSTTFRLTSTVDVPVGDHKASLMIQGRDGLEIAPSTTVAFQVHVVPFWVRYLVQLLLGGLALVVVAGSAVAGIRHIKASNAPPSVAGTLRHWPEDKVDSAQEVDLTRLKRSSITIGRGAGCDVKIADSSLDEKHAVLRAEKVSGEVRMVLDPVGVVTKGYQKIGGTTKLQHKDMFTMGTRKFTFLSDEG